ncbi:protein adenylyltransferase SelO [Kushneria aurantia]|uniref:Protein nucleotidyltransferase YdiU n=1 Tax=Kushneria aurantia TaxID=504092 RepID=A0ABV6G410_9GAMM|nr:YdiU family protein [Kushneria aurantia]
MFADFTLHYARLPARFFEPFRPDPVAAPGLIAFNDALAEELGIDRSGLDDERLAALLAGNELPEGAEPIAQAYAGHQFGNFVPRLGDGRAVLLGEVTDRHGRLRDIQLKGAGRTPFSRGGDGRAPLGPVLREYLVSEAMHALGVPTTRSLAAVTSGERMMRRTLEPGAVLTRVAASHIRVGTFQYFGARHDAEAIRLLADHVIERHYPELLPEAAERPEGERYLALLEAIQRRQAALVARWMSLGFIHGVMNTDNTTLSGETIDYGPCAFMERYDPATVFSSIDERGRYAYGNQPTLIQWNMARLAETLLPLIDDSEERAIERATEVVQDFSAIYADEWLVLMRAKLGLTGPEEEGDHDLVDALLAAMKAGRADFTLTFRQLGEVARDRAAERELLSLFDAGSGIEAWLDDWRARLAREAGDSETIAAGMQAVNPLYIARNHQVERALSAAVDGDFGPFETLREVLARPFEAQPGREAWTLPAAPDERVFRTFCGT